MEAEHIHAAAIDQAENRSKSGPGIRRSPQPSPALIYSDLAVRIIVDFDANARHGFVIFILFIDENVFVVR